MSTNTITRFICPAGEEPSEEKKQAIKQEFIDALTNVSFSNENVHGDGENCFYSFDVTCDEVDLRQGKWQ